MTTTHTVYDARSKLSLVLYATRIVQRKLTSEQDRPGVSQKRSKIYVPQTLSLSTSPYMATVTIFGPLYLTFRVAFFLTANFPSKTLILERCKVIPSDLIHHCAHLTHLELHAVLSFNVGDLVAILQPASSSLQSIILDSIPIPGGVFERIPHTSFPPPFTTQFQRSYWGFTSP